MDDKTKQKYLKIRREQGPLFRAADALRWAKHNPNKDEWESRPGHYDAHFRKVDGFDVRLSFETESQCPEDGDMGHYVEGSHSDYDYEWRGNYPRPVEDLPLNLPYTSFASGAYSQDRHAFPYWVPDGVEEQFDYFRRNGQSKQVSWELTKQWVEYMIRSFFGGPLYYGIVTVTVSKEGVELGHASIGTSYTDDIDGEDYIFDCASDHALVEEALEDARDTLKRLTEV
jgi:hypothetical protein